MALNILLLVVGFVLLIKGADIFVDGASSTAENFKISRMLIGLTIVAFGTSAPEFAVSMQALASGSTDMVLGNVIGSCIINILLILGIAAMIRPIKVRVNTVRKELPLTFLISTLLVVLFLDMTLAGGQTNTISRGDAIAILLFFSVFIYYLVALAKQKKNEPKSEPKYKLWKSLLFVALGLAGIIFGSDLVVNNATEIASTIGISERVIALTVIAFGTSLPELVTTIVASIRGEQDLLVGNIVGSNIFNICVVLGVPVAIFGAITPASFQMLDLIALVGSAAMLCFMARSQRTIGRVEGAAMLVLFVAYYTALFVI